LLIIGIVNCGLLFAQEVSVADSAQEAPLRLTPDEAVDMAIKNNLSLESARLTTSTKKRAASLWWNEFIPNITVAGSLVVDNNKGSFSGMQPVDMASALNPIFSALNQNLPPAQQIPSFPSKTLYGVYPYSMDIPRWHLAGTIQASLTISYAVFEYVKQLRLDYQGGLISYEKAKLQLERDIRKSFNNMALLQENIKLLRDSYEAAGRRVDMARANYRAGLVPELVYLQAQVQVENMRPMMDQVENGYRLSLAQFAMFLGLPYNTSFELAPIESSDGTVAEFIPLDVKDLISKAASGKPDIRELQNTILMLQAVRKMQLHAMTPALTLSWSATPVFTKIFSENSWKEERNWNKSGQFTLSLGMRVHSLIPWSPDYQGVKKMEDQIKTASIGLAQMIQGTEIEVYNTVLALERTRLTAEAQTQTIDLAERAYALSMKAYNAGLQDNLQVQNAELELKQAKVSMLEQQFNYLNGLIDLEYAIGVPFGTLSSKENR
jgi:outer membrane protein TolC